jgi:ABC-2 type transport system permease protein
VLGIALYLTAAGGLGALVDRQEQVGSMVVPLSIILVAGYLVGVSAADSSVGAVLAIVPFTSPMVMPARLALGVAGPTEVLVSLVVLTMTVMVVARLATVVYERAIVRTGRRLTLREVLRPAT